MNMKIIILCFTQIRGRQIDINFKTYITAPQSSPNINIYLYPFDSHSTISFNLLFFFRIRLECFCFLRFSRVCASRMSFVSRISPSSGDSFFPSLYYLRFPKFYIGKSSMSTCKNSKSVNLTLQIHLQIISFIKSHRQYNNLLYFPADLPVSQHLGIFGPTSAEKQRTTKTPPVKSHCPDPEKSQSRNISSGDVCSYAFCSFGLVSWPFSWKVSAFLKLAKSTFKHDYPPYILTIYIF